MSCLRARALFVLQVIGRISIAAWAWLWRTFVTFYYPNNSAKELCHYNCGLVVEPQGSAIASAIIQLYNNEALWKELSENALNVAKKYDWDMITNQMEAFFGTVVNSSGK